MEKKVFYCSHPPQIYPESSSIVPREILRICSPLLYSPHGYIQHILLFLCIQRLIGYEGSMVNAYINIALISCPSLTFLIGNRVGCQDSLDYFSLNLNLEHHHQDHPPVLRRDTA